jgi:hypothetical protein
LIDQTLFKSLNLFNQTENKSLLSAFTFNFFSPREEILPNTKILPDEKAQ